MLRFWSIVFYFLSASMAQSIIFGDEDSMKEARSKWPQGSYLLRICGAERNEIIVRSLRNGTSAYLETKNDECFGLTSAHNLVSREEEQSVLVVGERGEINLGSSSITLWDQHPLDVFQVHLSYDTGLSWEEQIKYNVGIFALKRKDLSRLPHKFSDIFMKVP